jgi:hypothetical protein
LSLYSALSFGDENNYLVLVKYQFGDAQADQKTTTVCSGLSTPCITGSFGAPTRNIRRLISTEFRYSAETLAVAPVVTRDYVNKVNGIDIPIYFVPTAKDAKQPGLNGGIDVGWRSDTHGSLGIFVGSNFDLLGL